MDCLNAFSLDQKAELESGGALPQERIRDKLLKEYSKHLNI